MESLSGETRRGSVATDDSLGCTHVFFNVLYLFWSPLESLSCIPFLVEVWRKTNSSICLDRGHLENGPVLYGDS